MQFYKRLKTRDWDRKTLEPIFIAAHKQLQSQPEKSAKTQKDETSTRDWMILHLEYHPNDIQRKRVRDLWSQHWCEYLLEDIEDGGLGIKQTILAYSRTKNLRYLSQKVKLYQLPGKRCHFIFRG